MKHLIVALTLATGCGSSLTADTMSSLAAVLEASKSAYTLVCMPPPTQALQCRSPEIDQVCTLGHAYINSAIGLYTELNDELKDAK